MLLSVLSKFAEWLDALIDNRAAMPDFRFRRTGI